MDVEQASVQIEVLIARRATQRDAANELEEMWKASERGHRERLRRENRAAWYAFYSRLADSLRARADDYDRRAEALCSEPGGGGTIVNG